MSVALTDAATTPGRPARDAGVDRLRGLAIFTMVAANLAGSILQEPHPFAFRLYGTFAAPLFIMLAGYMVGMRSRNHPSLVAYGLRGGLILLVAALLDALMWREWPFRGFDVLYVIGFSMPVAYLAARLSERFQWMLVLVFFMLTPILQTLYGYNPAYPDISLESVSFAGYCLQWRATMHHLFVDGWFPVFPWMGFALLGVCLQSVRHRLQSRFLPLLLRSGPFMLMAGILSWLAHPWPLSTRDGYSELFYPPTMGYLMTATGVVFCAFALALTTSQAAILKPLQVLGQCALFLYIFHYAVIHFYFEPAWGHVPFPSFVLAYAILLALVFAAAYGVAVLKSRMGRMPFLLKFLLGG